VANTANGKPSKTFALLPCKLTTPFMHVLKINGCEIAYEVFGF